MNTLSPEQLDKLTGDIDKAVEKHVKAQGKIQLEIIGKNIAEGFSEIRELGEGWTQSLRLTNERIDKTNEKVETIDTRLKLVEVFVVKRIAIWAGGLLFLGALALYLADKFKI